MVVSSVSLVPTVQVVHHTQLNEALLGVKNRPAARWHNHDWNDSAPAAESLGTQPTQVPEEGTAGNSKSMSI